MYYACFEYLPEKHGKNGALTTKKGFETREEARAYISEHFNPEIHSKCWTE